MKTRILAMALFVAALGAAQAGAQTIIDNTTLTTAITQTSNTIVLGSVTCTGCTFGADTVIYMDLEAMRVTGQYGNAPFTSTTIPVRRGTDGTTAVPHVAAAVTFVGPGARFHGTGLVAGDPPAGGCSRATQQFLPWINIRTGWVWTCDGSPNVWRVTVPYTLTSNSRTLSENRPTFQGILASVFRW